MSNSGRCLCGAVSFTTANSNKEVGACHCELCRKWSGGAFLEVECAATATFAGQEFISTYSSSAWAERAFCKNCGTHLFIRVIANSYDIPEGIGIPPGLFDDWEDFHLKQQVFIDQKPDCYAFSNDTRNINSDEIYKLYPQIRSRVVKE